MQLINIMAFRQNYKEYEYLKENSYFFKELNRGSKNYENFVNEMKVKYKERATDKLEQAMDSIDMVSSILDVLK